MKPPTIFHPGAAACSARHPLRNRRTDVTLKALLAKKSDHKIEI